MKKIFLGIIFFIFFAEAHASIPVENVFSDVSPSYKYYKQVQELYDRGMLTPDNEGKLNPLKLLTRDEFVGISSEVVCKKCIQPGTALNLIEKYTGKQTYFDIGEENKYFYCVADADEQNWVRGYDPGQKCENGSFLAEKRAFCPLNTITREEAYAVILRNSKMWTISQNEELINAIASGKSYANLATDVGPTNLNGTPYTFYGYFKNALEYTMVDYDLAGNSTSLALLTLKDGKIYPKTAVTKEEFILMAYIALRANNCAVQTLGNKLALKIDIKKASCTPQDRACNGATLDATTSTYDYSANVTTTCSTGIKDYIWRFYNESTSEKIVKHGQYLDNFSFPSFGRWRVYLRAIDNCGNTQEVYNTVFYYGEGNIGVNISIYDFSCNVTKTNCVDVGNGGIPGRMSYDFRGHATGLVGTVNYDWTFTNRATGESFTKTGEYLDNLEFAKGGLRDITLKATDTAGRNSTTTGMVQVVPNSGAVASSINIYDLSCSATKTNCVDVGNGGIPGRMSYDFRGTATGLVGVVNYDWIFTNRATGESFTKTGEYLDNLEFAKSGLRNIQLNAKDTSGHTAVSYSVVSVVGGLGTLGKSVSIDATPISGNGPLAVDFSSILSSGFEGVSYLWDFGDGGNSNLPNPNHLYQEKGIFPVTLTVKDKNGIYSPATIVIEVGNINSNADSDNDGVKDSLDLCPLVPGDVINAGCPIFSNKCGANCACQNGYICTSTDIKVCSTSAICEPDSSKIGLNPLSPSTLSSSSSGGGGTNSSSGGGNNFSLSDNCLYDGNKDTIFGNVVCNSCPCSFSVDYVASVRKCDALFPAITSPDSSVIYSRGNIYYVP